LGVGIGTAVLAALPGLIDYLHVAAGQYKTNFELAFDRPGQPESPVGQGRRSAPQRNTISLPAQFFVAQRFRPSLRLFDASRAAVARVMIDGTQRAGMRRWRPCGASTWITG
jgi:hypothetical protein